MGGLWRRGFSAAAGGVVALRRGKKKAPEAGAPGAGVRAVGGSIRVFGDFAQARLDGSGAVDPCGFGVHDSGGPRQVHGVQF